MTLGREIFLVRFDWHSVADGKVVARKHFGCSNYIRDERSDHMPGESKKVHTFNEP